MSNKLVSMKDVSLTLDRGPVLEGIDWDIREGIIGLFWVLTVRERLL